jgi:hypothetical protein
VQEGAPPGLGIAGEERGVGLEDLDQENRAGRLLELTEPSNWTTATCWR